MSNLIILRYAEKTPSDFVYQAFLNLKKAVPNKTVIAIPYDMDILENCSLKQLYEIKKIIDNAIKEKEQNGTKSNTNN